MKTLFKYSALLAAAVVLMPIDGFAQGHGQSGNSNQAGARERAQVERGQARHGQQDSQVGLPRVLDVEGSHRQSDVLDFLR